MSFFDQIGRTISLPFPNKQQILGVSGLAHHKDFPDLWTGVSENIPGSGNDLEDRYPLTSLPRLHHMKLDFDKGTVEFLNDYQTIIDHADGLKIEDMALVPPSTDVTANDSFANGQWFHDLTQQDAWLVSEANSRLVETNQFLSKDFGAPDLSSFDSETFTTSRLVRVDIATGEILEEADIPDFAQWDQSYDWESTMCIGDRPFQGLHALSIVPVPSDSDDESTEFDYIMFVGIQAALFQDGSTPTEFQGSATRVLVYGLTKNNNDNRFASTAKYIKSFRYDTSHLTMKSYQKGARHFNALFGFLALDNHQLLVVETEDLLSFGKNGQSIINRIFYVNLSDDKNTVNDECDSLLDCPSTHAPTKFLVWERIGDKQLDGLAWGPLVNGTKTIAMTFENDDQVGLHLELYALKSNSFTDAVEWVEIDTREVIQKQIAVAVIVASCLIAVIWILQVYFVSRKNKMNKMLTIIDTTTKKHENNNDGDAEDKALLNNADVITPSTQNDWKKKYAIVSAMLNSFLVGGLTFGYSGIVLILRKEGIFAENCACGSFWYVDHTENYVYYLYCVCTF